MSIDFDVFVIATSILSSDKLPRDHFIIVFLHIKIPRITTQAKEVIVAMSPTIGRGANPTYATPTPAITVASASKYSDHSNPSAKKALFAIATPKIIATAPCIIRLILLMPISIHLIPSATRNAMAFSSKQQKKK